MAIVSLVGVADTVYLAANHYWGSEIRCLLTEGCEVVLNSKYSELNGMPLAVLGLIFYAGFFILINTYDIYQNKFLAKIMAVLGISGLSLSVALLYIQLFLLKAVCFYCLISLISSTMLSVLAIMINRRSNQ
jgi:uncharacterized membrane protein